MMFESAVVLLVLVERRGGVVPRRFDLALHDFFDHEFEIGAAFALDQRCLQRCGFPATGAPGEGLDDLPQDFAALFGLADWRS